MLFDPSYFKMFAQYNQWANGLLYGASATLDAEQRWEDKGAFFGSLMGTLNHLVVGDRIWMNRFDGTGETYDKLDAVVTRDFDELRGIREQEDRRIVAYAEGLDRETLSEPISYGTITVGRRRQTLGSALAHFFNHQTHHRGQAHGLLSILGIDPPQLDLLYYQRESGTFTD